MGRLLWGWQIDPHTCIWLPSMFISSGKIYEALEKTLLNSISRLSLRNKT
ncbi:hypothetical protein BofuT4_uP122350.1 [Botrytis cinerea T4]|uniref:Uncharacterized protein n=1 Tax=Botryotinia fuckeliana (strain T4) TaxID=999810 RepID=G2YNL8_BOTF4|nr:hypothetical protein BofuT4_uP122350.1 [Botrytis cinerea T4]